ncbi:hypothetical protein ACLBXM_17805 [Xanthobacteraceae bacterium A53D]
MPRDIHARDKMMFGFGCIAFVLLFLAAVWLAEQLALGDPYPSSYRMTGWVG